MIISNSRNFIFVHVPKTAGTSLTRALEVDASWNDVIRDGEHIHDKDELRSRFGIWKHSGALEIKAVVGEEVWSEYFTFGFVRDPYQRLRSLYSFTGKLVAAQGWRRHLARSGRLRRPPFSWGWVRAYRESRDFSEYIRNSMLLHDPVAHPMHEYLSENGEIVVDYIGRCESLNRDFHRICQEINLEAPAPVRHNASMPNASLDSFYRCDDDYDWVFEHYRRDFEMFGYPRDPRAAVAPAGHLRAERVQSLS